ncbi:hypothetical protein [Nocardia pseudobrasiliensis]|uniref:Quercetin dioxygenase-like cupin family protein n=1 Tax=Nocardia pseudobrasiliensis TaxID=45979 RepID=A0A370I331_9NOCA|nr:hypothetical protein [Nocardia pseudobrasiliensis]RDI65145.1 hypothetical protein DFR76_10613 [Nocardia pseudobrasiliensis]
MSNYIPVSAQPTGADRTVLVDQDGVTCWVERVPPDRCSSLHRDSRPSITIVFSGGPVEVVDERDHLLTRAVLTNGRVIRSGELPAPYRLWNLADRALVLVVVELPETAPMS